MPPVTVTSEQPSSEGGPAVLIAYAQTRCAPNAAEAAALNPWPVP